MFTTLLVLILVVAIYGLISYDRALKRNHRELAMAIAMITFNTEECCRCAKREDCKIYIHATGFGNKDLESYGTSRDWR